MKIFLIILLVLLLLLLIVCLSHVTAAVSCRDGTFEWSVSYFGIRILPRRKKPEQPDAPAKPEKKPKHSEKTETDAAESVPDEAEKPEKNLHRTFLMDKIWLTMQNLVGKMDLAGSGIAALAGPLQMLLRSVTWCDIVTDIVIGGEDAADTARQYGLVQAGIQTLLDAAKHVIHVRRKQVCIGCDFTADASKWDFSCKFRFHIGTLLGAGIWLAWRFLRDRSKANKTLVRDVL